MMRLIKQVLFVVNIISAIAAMFWWIVGVLDEFLGPMYMEKLCKWLKIPWSMDELYKFAWICIVVFIVSWMLRVKVFGNL